MCKNEYDCCVVHALLGERHILSLKTCCDNTANGCKWTGELHSLKKHLTSCDFTLLPCPNECKEGSEVHQLLRKDMEQHIQQECPRRQYECPHCKEVGEYEERVTTHLEICPKMKVPCPNTLCNISISRCNISSHCQICVYEKVPCKYANIGCKEKVLRKDLREHEDDSQQHLQLAISTVQQLKTSQHAIITLLQLNKKMPITFRVTNFEYLKRTNGSFYSPAAYTSSGGYKMCINVDANGFGNGKGTHISVFVYLMQGENDDLLPWPFTGTVTYELLNQLENKNHHSLSTMFPQEDKASQRVVNRETSSNGYGHPRYIAHSKLGYNKTKNCQFLKDDCLYFRISVDAESSSKPWLTVNT